MKFRGYQCNLMNRFNLRIHFRHHSAQMSLAAQAKKNASYQAVDDELKNLKSDLVIGIGSGSTVVYAVERLGKLASDGYHNLSHSRVLQIKACIPSSFQAQQLILENGLPLSSLNEYPKIGIPSFNS
jgi:ribose 5-phosphate isomerase A